MSFIIMRKIPDNEERALTISNSYDAFEEHSSGDWEAISRPIEDKKRALELLESFRKTYRVGNKLYLFEILSY